MKYIEWFLITVGAIVLIHLIFNRGYLVIDLRF